MAISYGRSSSKPVTGHVAASLKQRPIIAIGPTDPRNNPAYLSKNPNVKVLTASDWANWLRTQSGSGINGIVNVASVSASQILDNTLITDPKNGQLDDSLPVLTNLHWDGTFKTVATTDQGILQEITITFDLPDEDDGTYEYLVEFDQIASNIAAPPTAAGASTGSLAPNESLQTVNGALGIFAVDPNISVRITNSTSTTLKVEFPKVSNAVSYNITLHGLNLPANTGSPAAQYAKVPSYSGYTKTYTSGSVHGSYVTGTSSTNKNNFLFILTQQNGYSFTGSYSVSVQANYSTGSSKAVSSATVTI